MCVGLAKVYREDRKTCKSEGDRLKVTEGTLPLQLCSSAPGSDNERTEAERHSSLDGVSKLRSKIASRGSAFVLELECNERSLPFFHRCLTASSKGVQG